MSVILGQQVADLDDRFGEPPTAPKEMADVAPTLHHGPRAPTNLDDASLAYVMDMQPAFDLLRQALGQMAALLVLAAAGGKSAAGHPMLALTSSALLEAAAKIHTMRVPPSARHHHHHVVSTERALDDAVGSARRIAGRDDSMAIETALGSLRVAHRHLLWATNVLPGFELVALSQSCCAEHARSSGAAPA